VVDPDADLDATEAACRAAQKGTEDAGEHHSEGGDNHTNGADKKGD
jgi:hypothetical protein